MFKNLLSNYGHSLILTLFVMLLGLFVFACVCKGFGGGWGVTLRSAANVRDDLSCIVG